jgi:hypothetical protein
MGKHELSLLSLSTLKLITPYLIEPKAAKLYGSWVQEQIQLGRDVTREKIVSCILKLEQNTQFQLTTSRSLPHHLASTQLGLPNLDPPTSTFLV